jgi:hypothetical protein
MIANRSNKITPRDKTSSFIIRKLFKNLGEISTRSDFKFQTATSKFITFDCHFSHRWEREKKPMENTEGEVFVFGI